MTQQINLFNPALLKKRDLLTARNVVAAWAVVLAGLATLALLVAYRADQLAHEALDIETQLKEEQAQHAALAKQLAELKPDARLAAELAQVEQFLAARREIVSVLQGGTIGRTEGFSDYMRAFARQSMSGLWLTGFNISAGGNDMEIRGRTLNAELVPGYIRRLNGEKALSGRSFASLDMKGVAEGVKPEAAAKAADPAKGRPLPPFIEFSLASAEAARERKP